MESVTVILLVKRILHLYTFHQYYDIIKLKRTDSKLYIKPRAIRAGSLPIRGRHLSVVMLRQQSVLLPPVKETLLK